jgi:nucleoside-triphosphatase THEP1
MPDITIITGPVSSGKTTLLKRFVEKTSDCAGFLCPDKEGRRGLYAIARDTWYPFEVGEDSFQETIQVGRFLFLPDSFALMQRLLEEGLETGAETILVDEVGWIELQGRGLEPGLSAFLSTLKRKNHPINVFLVVREQLVEKVIAHYGLHDATILSRESFALKYAL